MLSELSFFRRKIKASPRLFLVPCCHHRSDWQNFKARSLDSTSLLGADIVHFEKVTVVTGFMGYPHLLTLLAGIESWREKQLFFLGTAGCLGDGQLPDQVTVSSVAMTPELAEAFSANDLDLIPLPGLAAKRVITVDLPHRETREWLKHPLVQRADRVEMELFPLRVAYGAPFFALLLGSDHVNGRADGALVPYKELVREFASAFSFLWEYIHET